MSLQERLLFVEPTDFGWWYVCPAESAVTDPLSARTLGPSQPAAWNHLFQATTLSQQLQGEPAEQVHIALTGLASLPEKHGPHWIAVGDAVVKLDPLGSSGTATALDSGLRAAHAVADALLGSGTDLDRYGRWSTGLVEEFTRQRRQQYAIEALTRKDGFWPRRLARALEGGPNEGLHQRIDDRDQVLHGSSHRFKLNPSGMHLLSSLAKVTRSIGPERLSGNFYNCWFTET